MYAHATISLRDPRDDVSRSRTLGLGRTVVTLRGEYDAANAHELGNDLVRAIATDESDLVLHLGAVTFMDASTISEFIKVEAVLAAHHRKLSLCALSTPAARLTEICGLDRLIDGVGKATPNP